MRKKVILIFSIVLLFVLMAIGFMVFINKPDKLSPTSTSNDAIQSQNNTDNQKNTTAVQPTPQQYSLTDPTSIWIIANKTHPLPKGYVPTDLSQPMVTVNSQKKGEENTIRGTIQPSLKAMFDAAKIDNVSLFMASGFRSEALQATYYNNYVARDGEAAANRYSAKPGTSEHQTGLALDISATSRTCYLDQCFATMPEGKWLANNAYKYGFVLRYPEGKEAETGYVFEPWHYRYVGPELAKIIHESGETLEKHFGLL